MRFVLELRLFRTCPACAQLEQAPAQHRHGREVALLAAHLHDAAQRAEEVRVLDREVAEVAVQLELPPLLRCVRVCADDIERTSHRSREDVPR